MKVKCNECKNSEICKFTETYKSIVEIGENSPFAISIDCKYFSIEAEEDEQVVVEPVRKAGRKRSITVEGIEYPSIAAAAKKYNIHPSVPAARISTGWKIDKAFTTPVTRKYTKKQDKKAEPVKQKEEKKEAKKNKTSSFSSFKEAKEALYGCTEIAPPLPQEVFHEQDALIRNTKKYIKEHPETGFKSYKQLFGEVYEEMNKLYGINIAEENKLFRSKYNLDQDITKRIPHLRVIFDNEEYRSIFKNLVENIIG